MRDRECDAASLVDSEDSMIIEEHQRQLLNITAGCVWDANNYSCAYNSVFMSFYSIYGQSNRTWRDTWKAESPEWNTPLGNLFDLLLSTTAETDLSPQERALWFSHCRNIFREQMAKSNPSIFPSGRRLAPAVDMLQRILGGTSAEPLAYQNLLFAGCGDETNDLRISLSLVGMPFNVTIIRQNQDPAILPLQLALTRSLKMLSTMPKQTYENCQHCRADRHVRSFNVIETSWTWFELRRNGQSILPSLELSYHLPAGQVTHTLRTITLLPVCARDQTHGGATMIRPGLVSHWWKLLPLRGGLESSMGENPLT